MVLLVSVGALAAQTVLPAGSFGFLLSTSFSDPANQGGAALLGEMYFDGKGNVGGPFTLEYGSGGPLPATTITSTFTGTYSSNPDETGTITITLTNGITLTLAMVMNDSHRGLELVATGCTGCSTGLDLSASVFGGIGMHSKGFVLRPLAALKGSYGSQFTFSPQPLRSISAVNFDGAGNVNMSPTFVGPGPNVQSATYSGTYTVSFNATGTITLSPVSGQGAQYFVFVMMDEGGPGLLLMQINRLGNGVSFGTAHLQ